MRFLKFLSLITVGALIFSVSITRAAIPESGVIDFKILRNGSEFGRHTLKFEEVEDGKTRVNIDIQMEAGLGPFTFFRYEHSNEEIWQDNRILSMNSRTYDDGENYTVSALWESDAVEVTANGELYEAVPSIYTTSYWHQNMLSAGELLNTQKGNIEDITIEDRGIVQFNLNGEKRRVREYFIQASVPITIWYDDKTGQWIGLRFKVRGSDIEYRRINPI